MARISKRKYNDEKYCAALERCKAISFDRDCLLAAWHNLHETRVVMVTETGVVKG